MVLNLLRRRPDSAAAGLSSSSSPAVFADSSPNLSGVSPIEQNVLKKVELNCQGIGGHLKVILLLFLR